LTQFFDKIDYFSFYPKKQIENPTNKMSKVCCACLEEDEFSNSLSYSCGTCRDGYICFGCILEVDQTVSHKIKCPCCRTL